MFFDLIFRVGGQSGIDRIFQDEFFEFSKDKKKQLINNQEFIVYITNTIHFVLPSFCPKGRKCEDGTIDNKYPMVELDNDDYSYRTDKNIEFLDGVLIIQGDSTNDYDEVVKWIVNNNIRSLNVSGARKSNLLASENGLQKDFQKMREKCANVEIVLLKEKSELIKIHPILRYDECLLVPTQAFEESKNWICKKLPNVRKISVRSTSEAAKIASFSHSASLSNISCSTRVAGAPSGAPY
ncbi:hypothetical protein C2G38_2180528 [Gigaspora rosea]|uniref:Uncharacterized protein n=1 Tax=Gigaspora rosea TaxID=44941 RepID=A0A397VBU5_9GLOM|nr:hypothetical protein C2G38_2180528 [Gigaspora rosea]